MKREFKFRHADEIAGTLVICAVALFVLGVVLAGRSQGWFEGKFTLNIVFETQEGSFGLQEGAIVQVRNTVAGRVGKIMPTEGGLMGTTLILKERFHPFITKDSVAKVKKKFGVAGDSYVEIERGADGSLVEDEDQIKCVKDEELMETAQKMLAELESTMLPMFEEIEKIVASAASIMSSVEKGEGIAGAVVGDSALRDDLTHIVAHLEGIAGEAEQAIGQVGTMLTNEVDAVVGDVTVMADQARTLLTNDITRLASNMHGLQDEVGRTLKESRRLIMAVQRHWLFRKHVKEDSGTVALVPATLCVVETEAVSRALEETLVAARAADEAGGVARNAYNLAVARLAVGDTKAAESLNTEARLAYRSAGETAAATYLLEAELSRLVREFDTAITLVKQAIDDLEDGSDKETRVEAQILLATIYVDADDVKRAKEAMGRGERLNRRLELPQYAAALEGLRARVALKEGDEGAAAKAFTRQADHLREAGALKSMVDALHQAANVYANLGQSASAAEFYYRAASSLLAQDQTERAMDLLTHADSAAEAAGDTLLIKRIGQLRQGAK
jgi:hypothetical protein